MLFRSNEVMGKDEARNYIQQINDNMSSLMEICYEFERREGYVALGYKSLKECIEKELPEKITYNYAHKMINAGRVHAIVCPELPMGQVAESVLRSLHGESDDKKIEVWAESLEKCGGKVEKVTAKIIKDVVKSKNVNAGDKVDLKPKHEPLHVESTGEPVKDSSGVFRDKKLLEEVQLVTIESVKKLIVENGNRYESKDHFKEDMKIMTNELFEYMLGQYESLYDECGG